jgi:hypothetical protein
VCRLQRSSPALSRIWLAYGAALWALVFAIFHIIWAAGWYPLLDAEQARMAFATPWKWAFDVVVAAMCVIAVPLALTPVTPWGRHVPIRLVFSLLWIGSSLLLLRSIASLIQAGYHVIDGRFVGFGIWEPWFYLGAILFTLSALQSKRIPSKD